MSSSYYLYCEATCEAVATICTSWSGSTPDGLYSSKALFSFLAYHQRLDIKGANDFQTLQLESIDEECRHFVDSFAEIEDIKSQLEGLEPNLNFVLRWSCDNYNELLARDPELSNVLSSYDFGVVGLDRSKA